MVEIAMKTPIAALLLLAGLVPSYAGVIALDNPVGTGNQVFSGSVGMDFETGLEPVEITHFGAFDSGQDGFTTARTVSIYDRNNTAVPFATLTIPAGASSTLINGSRFVPVASTVTLPAGFKGSIVLNDVSVDSIRNNGVAAPPPGPLSTINNGGGLLRFVGLGRFGGIGVYPGTVDGGPANRYQAGTFQFQATTTTPKYVAYSVASGAVGAQNFGGSIGMDFDVGGSPVNMTHIGVFDSGQDGINGTLNAYIYNRDTQTVVAGPFSFSGAGDTLIGGSRFRDIADVTLPANFHGSVVVDGYNAAELLFNTGGTVPGGASALGDGNGLLTFTGTGRFGNPGAFPATADAGPANRYGAGTFAFQVPEPASSMILLLSTGLFATGRRRTRP